VGEFTIGDRVVVTLIRSCGRCYYCADGDEVLCEADFSLDRDVTAGVKSAIEQGFGLIRKGGTLVLVGMPASGVIAGFEPLSFANDCQVVLGSKMGSSRVRVDIPKLVELYQQGRLKLDELISERYRLEEINEAIASVKQGKVMRNVIVFQEGI
jgi:Zn-dependent alcohol dehydrogenase